MAGRHRAKQQTNVNVQVHCSNDHDTTLGIEDVAIVHASGTVVGYRFRCPTCSTLNEVATGPETIAVLHAFGVAALGTSTAGAPSPPSAHREAVSLRVLLDHPDVAASLLAPAPVPLVEPAVQQQLGSPNS